MRIFVDVEDTLLLNPNGVLDPGPCTEPNTDLLGALLNLSLSPYPPMIIVWSAAGPDLAREAAFKTLPQIGIKGFGVCHDKHPAIPSPDDVVIDDTEFISWARWYTPREFIKQFGISN